MKRKIKILIADDDITIHESITAALSADEFEVINAYDGQEALEFVDKEQPDLVVLDIMMPVKDGRDVCKDLKNNPKTSNIKVLMLSARDEHFERMLGLQLGADDYETKPFFPPSLATKIKRMCGVK